MNWFPVIASPLRAWLAQPLPRFLVAGGANTVLTGAVVVMLSLVIAPGLAFSIAFALGLAYAIVVNSRWVFRSHLNRSRTLAFALSYCAIYLLGLATIQLLESLNGPPVLRAASVLVTAPLSFLAGRRIFSNQGSATGSVA